MYIDKLNYIGDECNNTYDRAIKMKPVDVMSGTFIDFDAENNDKDRKFKVDGHVRISKYKSIFPKGDTPSWSEEVFETKRLKTLYRRHMYLNGQKSIETFSKNLLQKANQPEFRIEKVIKKKVVIYM